MIVSKTKYATVNFPSALAVAKSPIVTAIAVSHRDEEQGVAVSRRPRDRRGCEVGASAWPIVNASLYGNLDFNFINDVGAVAGIMRAPNVMVINPSVPAKTVPEFIAYAKANPGKINMATAGNGSGPHIYGELFKMMVERLR